MGKFTEKVVLITGAGSGIGYALAQAFAQEGAIIALNDIQARLVDEATRSINQDIGETRVYGYPFDVADVAMIRHMVADVAARFDRLDVIIANCGITNYGSFLDYTPEAFDRLTSVNLRGSYFTAQAGARVMIEKKIPGRILLKSSITGHRAFLNLGAYGITKAGIRMMARSLALELGPYGITVNAISPGPTLTERTVADDPDFEANWASVTPTHRCSYVEDIAAAALFLASPEARQITGEALLVDGGWTLHSPLPAGHPQQPEYSSVLR